MKEITIEDVLKKYIYKNIEGFGDGLTVDGAERACIEYASLNRQGWTRVEDGLPEVDTAVFVRTEYESSGKPMVDFFTAYMDEYGDTIICPQDESYGWQFNDVVTHWMPLPNKPSI